MHSFQRLPARAAVCALASMTSLVALDQLGTRNWASLLLRFEVCSSRPDACRNSENALLGNQRRMKQQSYCPIASDSDGHRMVGSFVLTLDCGMECGIES